MKTYKDSIGFMKIFFDSQEEKKSAH